MENKNNNTLYGVIIGLVALIVIGGGIWFMTANSKDDSIASTTTSSGTDTTSTPTPAPTPTPASNCFTAQEAWNHIGETGCVKFYVASPYRSSKDNVFLNEKSDYKNGFTAVVFSSATPNDLSLIHISEPTRPY